MARPRHFHLEAVEGRNEPGKHEACVTASNQAHARCCRLFQQQGLARSPAEDPSRSVTQCDSLHDFCLVVFETSLVERSLFCFRTARSAPIAPACLA